jgi:hypothetical protein
VEDDNINIATASITLTLLGFWRICFGCGNLDGIIHLTAISVQAHMLVVWFHQGPLYGTFIFLSLLAYILPLPPGGSYIYQYKIVIMLHVLNTCILFTDFIVYLMNIVIFKD